MLLRGTMYEEWVKNYKIANSYYCFRVIFQLCDIQLVSNFDISRSYAYFEGGREFQILEISLRLRIIMLG